MSVNPPLASMSRAEVRDYDARAIAAGMPGILLMENAGRGAAELLLALGIAGPVSIVAGKGNNGGDGFVIARHLAAAGCAVSVELVADPDSLVGDARLAYQSLHATTVSIVRDSPTERQNLLDRLRRSEWIVDALLGTGAEGPARPPIDEVIGIIRRSGRRILAIDLPSGLDADTGRPMGATVIADRTATFVARKKGFDEPASVYYTGPVHVIPIGTADPHEEGHA